MPSPERRITDQNGNAIPFSCQNRGFLTKIHKGFPHQPHIQTLGSVLDEALIDDGNYSLWLEHVVTRNSHEEVYWLMWYRNSEGVPTIPLSGIFGRDDLEKMVGRLTRFVP
ncbi:MAG: hypothetical protein ACRERE_14150 [Candidatus Entotheonellia bacterium]